MRYLIATTLLSIIIVTANAQENNPLINSGELIDKAVALHDEGKYKEAIDIYKKITRGDTNYYRAVYEMAYSQMLDSQFTAAKKSCETGLSVPNERWPELFTLYANLLDDLGDSERALRIYDSAISLYPAYTELYLNKGTTFMKLEKYAEAEEVFKHCLMINPYQASAHYKLGVCAMQQGRVIHAALSHINYLLILPAGRYQSNCITSLSTISKAGDDIKELIQRRTGDISDNFGTIEKILLSKIALDKQYKPLLKLDDPISRQVQVIFEKLEYDEKDTDFWMQFYVPLFKKFFEEKKFEPFINRLFAVIKIEAIQDYIKKNKKEIQEVVDETVAYYNQLRATRELNYHARKDIKLLYQYDNNRLFGKGTTTNNGEILTGDWEFYFSSGNIRSKGKYNDKGDRTGTWQYYHFNGVLKGRQTYNDGKLHGDEIFYFDNGLASSSATYVNDEAEGESRSYYGIGIPHIVAHYKSGKLNGDRKSFFSNGNLQSIEYYKDDSLHGPFTTFHKNGPVESKGNYNNGKLDGIYKAYFINGKLFMEGTYSNGKLQGPWKEYHKNGKIKLQETFAEGLVEGEYAEYYDNGQLFYKSIYKKGNLSGEVEYFDRDGKRFFIYTFDNDVTKLARYFDKAGNEVGRSERKAKKLDLSTYYTDGLRRSQAVYNDKGELIGTETYFYHCGKPSSESMYENGVQQGTTTHYYVNGQKQVETSYSQGEKHGYEKFWYSHGQTEQEGWYQEGSLQGTWLSYDELGNLSYTTEYLNNDVNGYKVEYFPNSKKNNEFKYKYGWPEEFVQFDTTGKEINRCILKNGSGKFKVVFFNGKTYGEGTYADGELDGPYRFYYFDGKLNTLQFYKKGEPDSIYRNYFYDGKLSAEGLYKWGKKEGTWKTYFPSGKLKYTENYLNGELTGKKVYYFENGKTDSEIEMEHDERAGWTKKFDEEGNLLYQVRFNLDLPVAYTYLDKSGKLLPEIPLHGGSGKVKSFFANGNPSSEFEYIEGKLNGPNINYYSNGRLRAKGNEDYSLSEGNYKYYYPNGQLQYDYNFLHDKLHGFYKEYNEKGIVTEEGYYHNGEPHNIIRIYDDSGKPRETSYYYYGKLLDIKK